MPKLRIAVIVVAIAVAGMTPAFAQEVGRRQTPIVDYMPPPDSLEGLWNAAHAVVRARVISVGAPVMGRFKLVEREHQFQVVEVLKAPDNFQDTFRVVQPGGTVMQDGVEVFTPYGGDFLDVSGEALLFLASTDRPNTYAPVFGPAGVFVVRGARDASQPQNWATVEIPNSARRIREFEGRQSIRLQDVTNLMHSYKGHRAKKN